jgi:hypothetical protein
MTKKQPSQKVLVLKHLLRYGSITDAVAREKYGITRLAARIDNLAESGWNRWWKQSGCIAEPLINTDMIPFKTRLGRRGRYAKYSLDDKSLWRELFKQELEGK